ncbi:MAG: hypothetical protein Q8K99_11745 [Actinomycetota bacterium]|nr:hypothetical protein [Actinomycetota bacterium]
MSRGTGILWIAAGLLAVVLIGLLMGPMEMFFGMLVVILAGVVPFCLGVVAQLLMKRVDLPAYAPWLLGIGMGILRFLAPQFGGLKLLDSEVASAVLTVVLSAGFAEYGAALARAIRRRRVERAGAAV